MAWVSLGNHLFSVLPTSNDWQMLSEAINPFEAVTVRSKIASVVTKNVEDRIIYPEVYGLLADIYYYASAPADFWVGGMSRFSVIASASELHPFPVVGGTTVASTEQDPNTRRLKQYDLPGGFHYLRATEPDATATYRPDDNLIRRIGYKAIPKKKGTSGGYFQAWLYGDKNLDFSAELFIFSLDALVNVPSIAPPPPPNPPSASANLTKEQRSVYLALSTDYRTLDTILTYLEMPSGQVLGILFELELLGLVEQEPMSGRYRITGL
ncbi:hypothetical protein [Coleofasciculus sp. FACHB-SPT9]|uniref:DprA-like winged helix domain-containing protein n=1 Tax=Cyanophyceae TaxID=3028117 RepID=UPI00168664F6|nr:hypothetical protein [Coleofasciculus sp. FACHB-SPT9]MBD1887961.1 hypothetical protein [Coleofasciculus sp. FACHB-SPT9]